MQTLSIDIETYSNLDLSKCGVYKYAASDHFQILLFAYSLDNGPVEIIDFTKEINDDYDIEIFMDIRNMLADD